MKKRKVSLFLLFTILFCIGSLLLVWDLYETILAAGDTPYRLHHGWYGAVLLVCAYITFIWVCGITFEVGKKHR